MGCKCGSTNHNVSALYHAHGESKQFHSEINTDVDLEWFPSGKFDTNELVLELAMPAYNILRMIGDEIINPSRPMKCPVKRTLDRDSHQESDDDGMTYHQSYT